MNMANTVSDKAVNLNKIIELQKEIENLNKDLTLVLLVFKYVRMHMKNLVSLQMDTFFPRFCVKFKSND